ncbi:MAG: hypothetical protein NTZ35_01270 [Ignavibacteriales bacterium]|nr:hypothetical protein [Ignavibacteriales bacterium]
MNGSIAKIKSLSMKITLVDIALWAVDKGKLTRQWSGAKETVFSKDLVTYGTS